MIRDTTAPITIGSAILGLVGAILALLTAFGVRLTEDQLTAILGFVSAVLIVAPLVLSRLSVARSRVVEQTDDGHTVTAGPANELPTGAIVREDLGARRALIEDADERDDWDDSPGQP